MPMDHIVWYGKCQRCGANRYLFVDELERRGYNRYDDMTNKRIPCKGGRCDVNIRIVGKQDSFRACHLNDIKRRGKPLNNGN